MKNVYIFFLALLFCMCSEDELNPKTEVAESAPESADAKSAKTYEVCFIFKDPKGGALDKVFVYIDDGYTCLTGTTKNGKITFKVRNKSLIICATNKVKDQKCGILSQRMVAAATNTIKLPAFPKTKKEAINMINKMIFTVNTSLDANELYGFLKKLKKSNLTYRIGAGVPGFFSISPLPYLEDGDLVFVLDGVLVEPIMRLHYKLFGQDYRYVSI